MADGEDGLAKYVRVQQLERLTRFERIAACLIDETLREGILYRYGSLNFHRLLRHHVEELIRVAKVVLYDDRNIPTFLASEVLAPSLNIEIFMMLLL